MREAIANHWVSIAVIIILYIALVYAIGKLIGDGTKEDEVELDGWNPAGLKPVHVGKYRVRLKKSKHEVIADWDGNVWRNTTYGFECYFQDVEWKPMNLEGQAA